jgi:hypothetical protein
MAVAATLAFFCARSILIWGFLGYAIGWPVAIVVLLLGVKVKKWEQRLAMIEELQKKVEEKQKPEGYQDFDNVHDLFKQLESK